MISHVDNKSKVYLKQVISACTGVVIIVMFHNYLFYMVVRLNGFHRKNQGYIFPHNVWFDKNLSPWCLCHPLWHFDVCVNVSITLVFVSTSVTLMFVSTSVTLVFVSTSVTLMFVSTSVTLVFVSTSVTLVFVSTSLSLWCLCQHLSPWCLCHPLCHFDVCVNISVTLVYVSTSLSLWCLCQCLCHLGVCVILSVTLMFVSMSLSPWCLCQPLLHLNVCCRRSMWSRGKRSTGRRSVTTCPGLTSTHLTAFCWTLATVSHFHLPYMSSLYVPEVYKACGAHTRQHQDVRAPGLWTQLARTSS